MTLGDKIRTFRVIKGYTQEVMSDNLGISPTAYAKIERDETDIPYSRLEQIAKTLETKVEDIVSFDKNIIFHNYSGSNAHSFGYFQHYHVQQGTLEERLVRLEQAMQELQKHPSLKPDS